MSIWGNVQRLEILSYLKTTATVTYEILILESITEIVKSEKLLYI